MKRGIPLRLAAVAAALFAAAASAPAAEELERPVLVGTAFCELAGRNVGKGMLYLFTRPFAQLVDDALRRSEEIGAANPDEKPPLGDGIPISSYPDQAPVCEVGTVTGSGEAAQVDIHHKFPETPAAGWTDRLVLAQDDGLLKIDDILYGAEDYRLGLREVAEGVLKQ